MAEKEEAKAAKLAAKEKAKSEAKAAKLAAKEKAKAETKAAKEKGKCSKESKFELMERDDMVKSLESKVTDFQSKNERAPTACELNELYAEVYV